MIEGQTPHVFIARREDMWVCTICGRTWKYNGPLIQDNYDYLWQHAEDHRPLIRKRPEFWSAEAHG